MIADTVVENSNEDECTIKSKNNLCNIKLNRTDYFTVPSLTDLDELVDEFGRCIVRNFTIGRHKYGNVTFYDPFDVAGLDLDSIGMWKPLLLCYRYLIASLFIRY